MTKVKGFLSDMYTDGPPPLNPIPGAWKPSKYKFNDSGIIWSRAYDLIFVKQVDFLSKMSIL